MIAEGVVEPGICPRPLENCLTFRVSSDITMVGTVRGLAPSLSPQVRFPVVDSRGQPAGTRSAECPPADDTGRSTCDASLPAQGQRPQLDGLVQLLGQTATPTPTATLAPGGSALPIAPLLPPVGPAPLPPVPPPPLLAPPVPGPSAPVSEVPVIPEATSAGLLAAGLLALAALAASWYRGPRL
ncbi:MAG: hypothetical protein IRZ14_04995 [Chloroflexi bacterium]|nr:hypothetical protein [Chloroflexota bacterium]